MTKAMGAVVLLFGLLMLAPALVGLVDSVFWVLIGKSISGIAWSADKGTAAWGLVMFGVAPTFIGAALLNAK